MTKKPSTKKAVAEAPSTKNAVAGFKPSTGDESYLTGAPKVPESWVAVMRKWNECREQAQSALDSFMDMGDILLKLRGKFKNDTEFGTARKKFAKSLSRQDAHRAMRMAENRDRFLPAPDEPVPSISVYAELFNASDELVAEVLQKTADPNEKTPTVKEVRETVKAETAEEFEDEIQDKAEPIEDADFEEIDDLETVKMDELLLLIEMPTPERIKALEGKELDTTTSLALCGFNPFFEGEVPCNKEIFINACNHQIYDVNEDDVEVLSAKHRKIFSLCMEDVLTTLYDD